MNDCNAHFEDPRRRADFRLPYSPTANGKDAPAVGAAGRNDRLVLEFLAAYYHLNCHYAALLEIRANPDPTQRAAAERNCLQAIERALIARDGLEDRCAPFGLIAEPVVENGFAVDVKFSFGNVDAKGKARSEIYTLTACVPIPFPTGAKLEDLPIKIEGPGMNPE